MLMKTKGELGISDPESLVCVMDPSIMKVAIENNDTDLGIAAELLPGLYWKIGSWNGKPVYRQEASMGPANQELFLFYMAVGDKNSGWYVSVKPILNTKELESLASSEVLLFAKGGSVPGEHVHIPYWSKKTCKGACFMPAVVWLENQLRDCRDELHNVLDEKLVQAPETEGNFGNAGVAAATSEANSGDAGVEKGKSDGKGQPSGWMNRAIELAACYHLRRWNECDNILDHWWQKFPKAREEIQKIISRTVVRSNVLLHHIPVPHPHGI